MALNFNKVNFNVRKTYVNVTVPNSPVARLMYYLNSTCSLLQLDTSDSPNLQRLTLYNSSWILTTAQKRELTVLCSILSPEKLLNKCIFIDKSLTGLNDFYEISAVHNQILVSRSIIINGQRKRVNKIMICLASEILGRANANHVISHENWSNLEEFKLCNEGTFNYT